MLSAYDARRSARVARQKRSRELTKDDWDEAIDTVRLFRDLERP
jgi:hypothetical protein